MARIRTIKPEFAHSETTAQMSIPARLFFILLWTICDDQGRTRAAPALLKGLLYPYDDITPETLRDWTEELRRLSVITVYEVNKQHYIQVNNWLKHQKISHPAKPRLPPPPGDPPEDSGDPPRGSLPPTSDLHTSIPPTSDEIPEGTANRPGGEGESARKEAITAIRKTLGQIRRIQ